MTNMEQVEKTYKNIIQMWNNAVANQDIKLDNCPYADNVEQRILKDYDEKEFRKVHFTKPKQSNYYYYASNIGRIMLVPQGYPDKGVVPNEECFVFPLKNFNIEDIEDGYLYLDEKKFQKNNPQFSEYTYRESLSIHTFVASAWLGKQEDDGLHVHHINNCGYDNRIINLVCLPAEIHDKINKK